MDARFTPGPWQVVHEHAYLVIQPLDFAIGIAADPVTVADGRLIAAAPELFALLVQITKDSPIYDDPDEGPFCTFCGAHMTYHGEAKHTADCPYIAAGALLARVQGEG